ncbi:unnamed protein product [Diatraea saccharalis]|uniref:CRAL-TRIO domain-containing protein n=1 Tax=Diatraea saccharalis TaxID=40085 RepID=A0A9N9R745_9NEOP|nr:unnamed protein product [Diatraea saccharalis]
MESLHNDPVLKFHPDTLKVVRQEFNLDKSGEMDRAIDILELWLKKQDHFTKKDFHRDYLERAIIKAKGSVERTKERLDKLFTARVLLHDLFVVRDISKFKELDENVTDGILPKLTSDHCRVYILQNYAQTFSAELFNQFYTRAFYYMEYFSRYDYAKAGIAIFDYRNLNVFEFLKHLDLIQVGHLINVALNGYGIRVKEIHIISSSKFITLLVTTFKQMLSEKLGKRIHVHSDTDTLHQYVDKDVLPEDCGGTEKSMKEIHNEWVEVLSADSFMEYLKETYEAKIDENLRPVTKLNDEYLGIAGTFRTLNVD